MWSNTYLAILNREDLMQDWMDNNKGHLRRALCEHVKDEIVEDHRNRNIQEALPSHDDLVKLLIRLKMVHKF